MGKHRLDIWRWLGWTTSLWEMTVRDMPTELHVCEYHGRIKWLPYSKSIFTLLQLSREIPFFSIEIIINTIATIKTMHFNLCCLFQKPKWSVADTARSKHPK